MAEKLSEKLIIQFRSAIFGHPLVHVAYQDHDAE